MGVHRLYQLARAGKLTVPAMNVNGCVTKVARSLADRAAAAQDIPGAAPASLPSPLYITRLCVVAAASSASIDRRSVANASLCTFPSIHGLWHFIRFAVVELTRGQSRRRLVNSTTKNFFLNCWKTALFWIIKPKLNLYSVATVAIM